MGSVAFGIQKISRDYFAIATEAFISQWLWHLKMRLVDFYIGIYVKNIFNHFGELIFLTL